MRIARSGTAFAVMIAFIALATTAHADPLKCMRAIAKESAKARAAAVKVLSKCKTGVIQKGVPASLANCPDAKGADKITSANEKMKAKIAKACGGDNKTCEAPPGDGDDALAAIHWANGCPGLEGQCTGIAVNDCNGIGDCLECIGNLQTEQAVDATVFDTFENAAFFPANGADPAKTINKCQITIAKVTSKFLTAKEKILNKCWDAVLKGKYPAGACPDTDPKLGSGKPPASPGDNKSVEGIKKAEQKKIAKICKACGAEGDSDKDGVCDAPSSIAIDDIVETVPYNCMDVTVPPNAVHPAGLDCGAITVTDLQSYVDCLDCVLEFKADCGTHAGVGDDDGDFNYPAECSPNACGNGTLDAGEDCDPPGSTGQCAALGAGNGNEVCTGQCKCQCPDKITFRGDASSANSDLDTGWTGIAHDNKIVSNGDITVHVDSCANPSRPCGVCSFSGPIDNPGADAGSLNDRRCRNDSSVKCTSNGQCSGAGNACVYWFGAPLSLSSGGVATCVTNEVIGALTGTANIETGTSASTLNLTSHVYTGVLTSKPCPKCTDAGGINDGVAGGTCTDGPRAGMTCDANSESPIPAFGRTSLDCPPDSGSNIANLPIALGNSTGTESRSLSAASPDCSAFGFTGFKCPCDTCDDAASTPCSTDADCGGGTCGGLRCLVDAPTPGLPCSSQGTGSDPACCSEPTCTSGTIGTCDRPGEATKPNACSDGQCVSGGGTDDGMCHLAPSDNLCSVETFRSCTGNADCRPPGEGGTCADCAPGMQTCTTKRRECLLGIDDHLATHTGTIDLHGMADTPVADVSHPILASMFCIGPTGSSSVNAVAGLPGLGKLRLNGTAQGLP